MVYMYHSFLIHSSADGHLGCFHVLAIINSAAMNIGVQVSLSDLVSLVCMPRSGIAEDPLFRHHGLTNTPLNSSRHQGNGRWRELGTPQGWWSRQRCEEAWDCRSDRYWKAPWGRIRGQEGWHWAEWGKTKAWAKAVGIKQKRNHWSLSPFW